MLRVITPGVAGRAASGGGRHIHDVDRAMISESVEKGYSVENWSVDVLML